MEKAGPSSAARITFPRTPGKEIENGLCTNFDYITKDLVNQELELQVRSQLMKIKTRIRSQQILQESRNETVRHSLSKDFLNTKLCDILPVLGNPKSTKSFNKNLTQYKNADQVDSGNSTSSSSKMEDIGLPPKVKTPQGTLSKRVMTNLPPADPSSKTRFIFPDPKTTPANNGKILGAPGFHTPLFAFTGEGPFSTLKKPPRPAKPGETIYTYSCTGSPVIQSCSEVSSSTLGQCPTARIKVDGGNGKLIDVDLVYRGGGQDGREFREMVTDIRGMIATRSETQSRKLLKPRVLVKKRKSIPNPGGRSRIGAF